MRELSALIVACFLLGVSLPGSVTVAQEKSEAATDLQSKYDHALREIGRLQSELDQAKREIEQLQQQLGKTASAPAHNWFAEGNRLFLDKKYTEALAAFSRAIAEYAHDARFYRNRGIVYQHSGDYQKAIADFNHALTLAASDAITLNQRGIAYFQWQEFHKAIEDFTAALASDPKLAAAYHNRGIVYRQLGNYRAALDDIQQADQLGLERASQYLHTFRTEVQQAQQALQKVGLDPGPANGIPGQQTIAALLRYQRSQGLSVNGRLDNATRNALGLRLAALAASSSEGGDTPSQFVRQAKPDYPLLARQHGWEGTVTLRLELLADGTVGEVEVAQSSGYPVLDTAAQEAARTWTHQPAQHNNVPVAQWVSLKVNFVLDQAAKTEQKLRTQGGGSGQEVQQ
jgi:TonB family protein